MSKQGISIEINPVPASRPRVTRNGTYYGKKYTQFRDDIKPILANYKGTKFSSLVKCEIIFNIAAPKSKSIKQRFAMNGSYCDNNADIDNYIKAILDSLNNIAYDDDRQVVELTATKKWSEKGYIDVFITEIDSLGKELETVAISIRTVATWISGLEQDMESGGVTAEDMLDQMVDDCADFVCKH